MDEIGKMERGLPRLSEYGEDLLVPFPVRQLRGAKPLWLNRRWFLERGIDITDNATLDRISTWLVSTFGYINPGADDRKTAFTDKTKVAYADRYGSSGGTAPHGGSGRAAIYGCFQAKGVGVTPLVGVNATPDHINGCASLAEGIREAIYAEIVASEFSHSAIPIIALLDTGLYYSAPNRSGKGNQNIRRAIVIRPSVLRPAHAERAALFSQSVTGYFNSQASDVKRTRDFVRYWSRQPSKESVSVSPSLRETLGRVAEQAAYGQVHRLFSGGYFSSNLSVTGELLDFGNMHVLPDWANARVLGHTAGFGKELEAIDVLATSMDFYFRKYSEPGCYLESAESLGAYAKARYRNTFADECLRLWQAESLAGSDAADQIVRLMQSFFSDQQRGWRRYKYGDVIATGGLTTGHGWLYDALIADREQRDASSGASVNRLVENIDHCLRQGFQSEPNPKSRLWISWVTALRLLRPRKEIDRGIVLQRIRNFISQLNFAGQNCAERVTELIQDAVNQGRANWPRLPSGLGVLAHVTRDGCSALLCSQGPSVERQIWVEAICIEDRCCLFGNWIPMKELGGYSAKVHGGYLTFLFPESEARQEDGLLLRLGQHEIRIPEMSSCVPLDVVEQLGALWDRAYG